MAIKPTPGAVPNYGDLSKQGTDPSTFISGPPMAYTQLSALRDSSINAGHEDTPRGRELEMRYQSMKRSNDMTKEAIKNITKKAKGGKVKASSASKRGDGIAQRGKTKGRMV